MHGGGRSDRFGADRDRSSYSVLTGKGWVRFPAKPRGGNGYGNAFLRSAWWRSTGAAPDVMTGVDRRSLQGLVDADRPGGHG
jgi:dipeptidyl aminopeptidase/acylaminoacyl peptidase